MNKSTLIITLVINTLLFVLLIGCYETVDPNTSSTTKKEVPEQRAIKKNKTIKNLKEKK